MTPPPAPPDRLTLIVPGNPDQRTGGYLYDARIAAGLRLNGTAVEVIGLAGRFPDPDATARRSMHEALGAMVDGAMAVIDGLALGGVPESVAAHADRLTLIGLVHHPLADETGLDQDRARRFLASERAALSYCRSVIVTSPFTRRRLLELDLADPARIRVVEPGVDPAPLSERVDPRLKGQEPNAPARLLCVASLSPRKGQDILIEALGRVGQGAWTLELVGSADRDPAFARAIEERIRSKGLESRVRLVGEADALELARRYHQADVCLVPSWYEGYGMVVTEALARGLPLIATTGGALEDTVPPAAALRVRPGCPVELGAAIERWLADPALRLALTQGAVSERAGLKDWTATAKGFAAALVSDQTAGR
jgi:glycosyltransferase involved in cell wall biosynthesis